MATPSASAPTDTKDAAPTPAADEAAGEGGEQMSKRMLKKMAKGKLKEKKEKDTSMWTKKEGKEDKKKKPAKEEAAAPVFVNTTPKGDKKDLTAPMAPGYQPAAVEAAWGDWWEKSGFYHASAKTGKTRSSDEKFVMVIPPPNVTGSLHCGHALSYSIEDTITRWRRMLGHTALWIPGTDHAGIATQAVVEKRLLKDEGLTRHDLGREKFLGRVWDWKHQYHTNICTQIRKLGLSVDWTREAFTMDDARAEAVKEAFIRFYESGLVYRATRLVNWSCKLRTAISDLEVDYIDLEGITKMSVPGHDEKKQYEFGTLTSFAYKVENSDEEIVVATTRLETMLGDTAVAVHPDDERYKHLHGKKLIHPFSNRKIPIVTDSVLVDMAFGTGAVKITPAHDPNDYACGKRNNLEFINILNEDGSINHIGGKFKGLMRYDARIAVEQELTKLGLFRGKEVNKMRLGICSRSGDIIEPYLIPQWYVNCQDMAAKAVKAVREGDLKIVPSHHETTWYRWLENIQDWCISRQLWWGHRIPAYYISIKGRDPLPREADESWTVGYDEKDAKKRAAKKLNVKEEDITVVQDEDVLDTWFSSGLFPFSTLGWPNKTEDLEAFYPNTLLETGHDILFFWVARMVMMGIQLTGKLPFKEVYLHAMVRDKYGRKMSKSLGNVVDPLEVIGGCTLETLFKKLEQGNLPKKEIEKAKKGQQMDFPNGIPECGADGFRMGLLAYTVQGRDVNLDIQRVVGYRNFCNKLWNATRFAMTNLGEDFRPVPNMVESIIKDPHIQLRDKFILSRLHKAATDANNYFKEYQFGNAVETLYSFWLYDLCDVYLELIKPVIYSDDTSAAAKSRKLCAQRTLYICLDWGLRLLHPIMPFVTEELWQRLPGGHEEASIMIAQYPLGNADWENAEVESAMGVIKDIIHATRSLRAEYDLKPSAKPQAFIKVTTPEAHAIVSAQSGDICTLTKCESATSLLGKNPPAGCAMHVINDTYQVQILLKGLVDFDSEIAKLEKKLAKLSPSIDATLKRVNAEDYTEKVPEDVRAKDQEKLDSLQKEKEHIEQAIGGFQKLLSS